MKLIVLVVALLLHQVMCDTGLVTSASNDFANRLYQKVSQPQGNVLICPLSLHVALALVHQGAGGNTAQQLATALGFRRSNSNNIKESYKAVLTKVKDNTLKIATKLFPAQDYQLNNAYVNIAQSYFLSDVENVDYRNAQAAASKINQYVEEKTNNKIHNLISADAITPSTKLIIVNAVHFQATWKKTFATAYLDDFRPSKSEPPIKTRMMSQTDTFEYKEDPGLQAKVLKMDYSEGDYSMVFILPNKEDGLGALEARLATLSLENILKNMAETRVEVTIPKFKLEQTHNLKQTLSEMGMQDIFTPRADLSKVATGGERLYVSDVIQKTFINVHENGTEAAAATVLLETLSANFDEKTFFAKRPFHFYLIRSKGLKMVLFEGKYVRPEFEETDSEETDVTDEENVNAISNNKKETETSNKVNVEEPQHGEDSKIPSQTQRPGFQRPNGGLPTQNSQNVKPDQIDPDRVRYPTTTPSGDRINFEESQHGNENLQSTGHTHQTGNQRPNVVSPTQNSPKESQNSFDTDRSGFTNPTANTFNNQPQNTNQPQQQSHVTQPQQYPQGYYVQQQLTPEQIYAIYVHRLAQQIENQRRSQTQTPAYD